MTSFSLPRIAVTHVPHGDTASPTSGRTADPTNSPAPVGRISQAITPSEREEAIELAELKEAWYEHQGFPIQAEFMRELQRQLKEDRQHQGESE